jgi:hypothetical protein
MIHSLEEYLAVLRSTSDETTLKQSYGVYDNYYIYLRTDFDQLVGYLSQNGFVITHNFCDQGQRVEATRAYGFTPIGDFPDYRKAWLNNVQTELSIVNVPECGDCRFGRLPTSKRWLDELATKYHTTITIHPKNSKEWGKDIAQTIIIIGEFCLENKVPACLPYANGSRQELTWERFLHHRP